MSYDNNLQIIVSKVISDNTKAPTLRAQVDINGVKHKAGLWPWKRKDGSLVRDKAGNAQYIGTLEVDDFVPKGAQGESQQADHQPEFDDDIPW